MVDKKIVEVVHGRAAAERVEQHSLHFERVNHASSALDCQCDRYTCQSNVRPGIDDDTTVGERPNYSQDFLKFRLGMWIADLSQNVRLVGPVPVDNQLPVS